MHKNLAIQALKSRFREVIENWGVASRQIDAMCIQLERWLGNFETSEEVQLAFKVAQSIQYKNDSDIADIVKVLSGNLIKQFESDFNDVLFFPLGVSSNSSGSMYLYKYSKELGWCVNDDNFPYDDFRHYTDKVIVFFDDMIGSGNQAIKFANKNFNGLKRKPYYAAVFGFTDGAKKIKESNLYDEVIVGERLANSDSAFHPQSTIFEGGERDAIKLLCTKYGTELYPAHPLGYDDSQALLAFSHNTPNNTLPIIWAGVESESEPSFPWHPLFPRKKIIRRKTVVKTNTNELSGFPSFNKVVIETSGIESHKADMFYNGMPCRYEDIRKNYDIPRTIYTSEKGIRKLVMRFVEQDDKTAVFCSIKGKNGGGKTTVLKRLIFEAHSDCNVFEFNNFRHPSITLSSQIENLLGSAEGPAIIVFDDAECLNNHDTIPSEIFAVANTSGKKVLLIFSEQTNKWNFLERTNEIRRKVGNAFFEYTINELDDIELAHLADNTIEFERNGEIIDIKCVLPREDRLQLCSDIRERLIIVALLTLRYGKHIASIVENEYEQIPSEEGKNAYALVCLFDFVSLKLPISVVLKASGNNQPATNRTIRNSLEEIVYVDTLNYTYEIRHSALTKYLFSYVYNDPPQILSGLNTVIEHIDPTQSVECSLLRNWFTRHGFQKQLFHLLADEQLAIDFFEHTISVVQEARFDNEILKHLYAAYGLLKKDVLRDDWAGIELFNKALRIDSSWAFCLRQKSWAYLNLGENKECSHDARQAIEAAPEDAKNLMDCAYLLSLGDLKSFKKAGVLYEKADSLIPDNMALRRRIDNYQGAKNQLEYLRLTDDQVLPDYVVSDLKPGPFFWKARKGLHSKQYANAIKARLSSALQNNRTIDKVDLENQIKGTNIKSDKLLNALYKANYARALYNRWYRGEENIDTDLVKELFETSLKLWPKEPIIRAWYSTFIKEVTGQYELAEKEIDLAIHYANKSKYEHFHNHPLLLNNKALIYMDGYYKGIYEANVLPEAEALLRAAIRRVEETESSFHWPYDSLERLETFKQTLP